MHSFVYSCNLCIYLGCLMQIIRTERNESTPLCAMMNTMERGGWLPGTPSTKGTVGQYVRLLIIAGAGGQTG